MLEDKNYQKQNGWDVMNNWSSINPCKPFKCIYMIKYLGIILNNFAAGVMNRYRSQNSIATMVKWCETEKRWKEQLQASKEERALTRPTITIKSNGTMQKRI